jgi:hypothetical protein
MRFTAYKVFSVEPIGDIHFRFNNKGRKPNGKVILTMDVTIFDKTRMTIDNETEKELMKLMKAKGSDLLTDGTNFYTLFGGVIGQIDHPQFHKELELHRQLYV